MKWEINFYLCVIVIYLVNVVLFYMDIQRDIVNIRNYMVLSFFDEGNEQKIKYW